MNIGSQSLGLGRFEKYLVARAHAKKKRKKILILGLTLTAMVDMFSVLVIFLLQTFSTSPEMLVVTKGVTLPSANTGNVLKDAPVLSISKEGVFLDQKLMGPTEQVLLNPEPLMEKLEELRTNWQRSHPDLVFNGEISLQADQDIPSTTVSQIMAMLPGQAYSTIQLAVVGGAN